MEKQNEKEWEKRCVKRMVAKPRQNGIKNKNKWNEMQKVNSGIKKGK